MLLYCTKGQSLQDTSTEDALRTFCFFKLASLGGIFVTILHMSSLQSFSPIQRCKRLSQFTVNLTI